MIIVWTVTKNVHRGRSPPVRTSNGARRLAHDAAVFVVPSTRHNQKKVLLLLLSLFFCKQTLLNMQTLTLLLLAFIIISHIMDGCSQSKSALVPYTTSTLKKMDTLLWRKQGKKRKKDANWLPAWRAKRGVVAMVAISTKENCTGTVI